MGGTRGNPPGRARERVRPRGNIEERAGGALRVRVYAGVDVLTGRAHYLKETVPAGPDAREKAEEIRDEFIKQIETGRHPRTNATVGELLTKHLENADLGKRARQSLQGYARKHVHPLKIGISTIGEIGIQVLETFYAELRRCRDHCDGQHPLSHYSEGHRCSRRCRRHECKGLADATIRKIHFMLSAAFDTGVRWGWITSNPTVGAKHPAPPPPMPKPPTAEQAAALVNECWRWSVELGLYVWLAMTTGARRGELCSLRWSDLQAIHNRRGEHDCMEAGCRWILVIDSAIAQSADEKEIWEKDTKTHQHRFVALDPESVALILEFRKVCEQAAEALGITLTDDHFMFAATPEGVDPKKPSSFSNRYQGRARHLAIKTCLKNLRHYSATELIIAGVDIRTVAGRLGHGGGGTTTLKVYAAWVAAADQHASTALMNRMPLRPAAPLSEEERTQRHPRYPYERIAATLHELWKTGGLATGSTLTAVDIAESHGVAVGTAHRAMGLLQQWGVLNVTNGGHRPSTVVECPDRRLGTPSDANDHRDTETPSRVTPIHAAASASKPTESALRLVLLDLIHLGTSIRTMEVRADVNDFNALENLLRSAVRRSGGDLGQIDDYELEVRIPGQAEPVTTVVVAA